MNILYYSQLDEPTIDKFVEDINKFHPNIIVLFCETEWDSRELTIELAEILNLNNIKLIVTFCSYPNIYYEQKTNYFNNIELVHWPTYWMHWTLMCSKLINFNIEYNNFKYPFICLNNKNHKHRCALIDELTGKNLLELGIVTWHRFPNKQLSDHIYKFKYYNDNIRVINDDFDIKLDSFLIPNQYHESFLHVIGEATTNVTCISEKTWLPILFKKPWIIMADQYFHQKLVDLGFELYDEIIDYSFDIEPDIETRALSIAENVKKITSQNVNDLYNLIKPKTERNYQNYMRIVKDKNYVPKIIMDRAIEINNKQHTTFTDGRYVEICKTVGIINEST